MRILVHDFGGYAFALRLSLTLAERGHEVCHAFCASLITTPPGIACDSHSGPPGLTIARLHLKQPLDKYSFFKRWRQEREYGRLICDQLAAFEPDVVLSGNAPLDAQKVLIATCRKRGISFVYWLQDLVGIATYRLLRRRLFGVGWAVGIYYRHLETSLLRTSDHVVVITRDFEAPLQTRGVPTHCVTAIENWADLATLPTKPKNNPWSRARGLHDKTCLLYAGTLSMKHDPGLLVRLAERFRENNTVRIVVITQGSGADYLAERRKSLGLNNLILIEYQPTSTFPDILGAADVLVAVLEPDAAEYSVPSKILTYLCAARPLLLAVSSTNLAARIVEKNGLGIVVAPHDMDAFYGAAEDLVARADVRREMGCRARAYAETVFNPESIADHFTRVFEIAAA